MDELKTQTMSIITEINNDWVAAVKRAEEDGEGLDMSETFSKFTEKIQKLDKAFLEAKQRVHGGGKKRGGFW